MFDMQTKLDLSEALVIKYIITFVKYFTQQKIKNLDE
jgi:hypothetical protein